MAGARIGQFVEIKITHWPTSRFQPQGDIVEVIGNYMAPGMEIDVALRSYDIPHVWPEAVVKEARKLKPEVEEKDKEKRIDLRHLPFVTIDGEDARDFDDAVYCEKSASRWNLFSGGWKLLCGHRRRVALRQGGLGPGCRGPAARQLGVLPRAVSCRCCRRSFPTACARSTRTSIAWPWSAK